MFQAASQHSGTSFLTSPWALGIAVMVLVACVIAKLRE